MLRIDVFSIITIKAPCALNREDTVKCTLTNSVMLTNQLHRV